MAKSILILYSGDDWRRSQPAYGTGLRATYDTWEPVARAQKTQILRACIDWFQGGYFLKYWLKQRDGSWAKVAKKIRPTVVYDRCPPYDLRTGDLISSIVTLKHAIARSNRCINVPEFTELIDSKLYQNTIFAQYTPSARVWLPGMYLHNPRKKQIVLKKIAGSGGDFVTITRRAHIPIKDLLVEQAFVKASNRGTLQDTRIMFFGDQPQYAFHRVAPEGSLYTNIHLGATVTFEPLTKMRSLVELCQRIAQPLRIFPKRVFSLDFLTDARTGKHYLIESNSMTTTDVLPPALMQRYLTNLTRYLLSS